MAFHTHRTATLLGLGGAAPFVVAGLGAWILGDGPLKHWLLTAVFAYGAVILSFLGGIHWGLALRDTQADDRSYVIGVLPALLAWLALLIPLRFGLALLAVCFVAQLVVDLIRLRLPGWFRNLRALLSVIVVASLVVALLALMQ